MTQIASAQSTVVPIDDEPAPTLIVEPPLPGPLAQGVAFIPYRVENLRILPVGGPAARNLSPRVGHLHITVDDLPWQWADYGQSDTIILVATLDIPALKGLKLATGTLDLLNFPRDTWKFVLNRADGKVGLTTDEFESTLGLKADIALVSSREVLSAVNRGEALVKAYPTHPNSKAITALALSFVQADDSSSAGSKASGSRLRLRRG